MSARKIIFAIGETYHIFNRSVQGIPIFKGNRECRMFMGAMEFYLQSNPPVRFSIYRTSRDKYQINPDQNLVTVLSDCLMPNHFHLLLRQEKEDGIKKFIQRISNSFSHYFSLKNKSRGHIFEGNFKAVHIEDEEQLLHVSRYIHLNPVTSFLVNNPEDYEYSSYGIYVGKKKSNLIDTSIILAHFSTIEKYKEFILSQKDYQRKLQGIKHLLFE